MINTNMSDLAILHIQHPRLKIIPLVDEEIVLHGDFNRWMGSIGKSYIDEYYKDDECIFFKSKDIDSLEEYYSENIWIDDKDISDEKLEKETEIRIKDIPWEKAIFVNIDLP